MLISNKLKCIFVHLTKTGGWSIEEVLKKYDKDILNIHFGSRSRHMLPSDLRQAAGIGFDSSQYKGYFKFGFVRNPWDRLVSTYFMCTQYPLNPYEYYVKDHTFNEFIIDQIYDNMIVGINQSDYLFKDGKQIVDFIGRFENLEGDFKVVCKKLGISHELHHINATKHAHYSMYYNEQTKNIVANRFREDIERFNYKFDDSGVSSSGSFILSKTLDHYRRRLQSFAKRKFPAVYSMLKEKSLSSKKK